MCLCGLLSSLYLLLAYCSLLLCCCDVDAACNCLAVVFHIFCFKFVSKSYLQITKQCSCFKLKSHWNGFSIIFSSIFLFDFSRLCAFLIFSIHLGKSLPLQRNQNSLKQLAFWSFLWVHCWDHIKQVWLISNSELNTITSKVLTNHWNLLRYSPEHCLSSSWCQQPHQFCKSSRMIPLISCQC